MAKSAGGVNGNPAGIYIETSKLALDLGFLFYQSYLLFLTIPFQGVCFILAGPDF